jgi:replicative DNA helicase
VSVGYGLLRSLREDSHNFIVLQERGITVDSFKGEEKKVYRFIEQFYLQYGTFPSDETIQAETQVFPNWSALPGEPFAYWIDKILERDLLSFAGDCSNSLHDALSRRDLEGVRQALREAYVRIEMGRHSESIRPVVDVARDVVMHHNFVQGRSGIPGIPFAFPFLNTVTGGMQQGDTIILVGRPAAGKSYILLNDALHCNSMGYSVLFLSMEMPLLQCGSRILALKTGINHTRLRLGRVSYYGIARVNREIEEMSRSEHPFHLVAGGIFSAVDDFYAQLKHYQPDIAFIDGAYLMRASKRGKRGSRWETVMDVIERVRQISLAENTPIEATYQFNRKDPGTLEGISYSDAIGQLGSLIISLEHDGDAASMMRPLQYKLLKFIKGREGEAGILRVRFDFERMSFSEEEVIAGLVDDREFDRGEQEPSRDQDDVRFERI